MAHSQQLLATKIRIPPLPASLVPRERLLQVLDEGMQPARRLILISAPPGYGKTTLLNQWIRSRRIPGIWISLDQGDNDPARFLGYLHSAIRAELPDSGGAAPVAYPGILSSPSEAGLRSLPAQLERYSQRMVLILDDYHLIRSQAVHDLVSALIDHLPSQAHLVISTRADPPLPVALLRGRGQMTELRMADLRFAHGEAADFLRQAVAASLTDGQIDALARRTEGWVSGLQMAAASLRGHKDADGFVRDFSGTHRHILDYLVEEVLSQQPAHVQDFLLRSAILDRMCGPLCDALGVAGQTPPQTGRQILEAMDHANLFIVPLDDQRNWFRYHRLFGDLLRKQLQQVHSDWLPDLHRRASRWLEREGLMEEAIQHVLAVSEFGRAAELIEANAQRALVRGEIVTFLGWVRQLPVQELRQRPKLAVHQAWALLMHGAPLAAVEASAPPGDRQTGPPGSNACLQAFLALFRGRLDQTLEHAGAALAALPESERYMRQLAQMCAGTARISLGDVEGGLRWLDESATSDQLPSGLFSSSMILCELADLRSREGRLREAAALYERALALGTDENGNRLPISGRALIGLADLARERNELDEAEELIQQGLQLVERWSILGGLNAHITLAMIREAQGESRDLPEILQQLRTLANRFDASDIDDLLVDMVEARLRIRQGDAAAGRRWADQRGLLEVTNLASSADSNVDTLARLRKYEAPILARLHLLEGQPRQALAVLDPLISVAQGADRRYLWIEAEILRARAYHALGERVAALAALQAALELGESEAPMRVFLDEDGAIRELLLQLRPQLLDPGLAAYADRLLTAFSPVTAPASTRTQPVLIDRLSDRELEVLRLLPTALSGAEMADRLTISVNTLRSHLKSIYAKLGVHSRQEALARASALDLLP